MWERRKWNNATQCIHIDEITHTIHSVYIHKAELFSTVSFNIYIVHTQIHVEYCIGNAEDETICRWHQYKMQWCILYARRRRKFLEVHCVCIFTSSYQNHMEPYIICIICMQEAPCVHGPHVRKATMCNYLYRVSADAQLSLSCKRWRAINFNFWRGGPPWGHLYPP